MILDSLFNAGVTRYHSVSEQACDKRSILATRVGSAFIPERLSQVRFENRNYPTSEDRTRFLEDTSGLSGGEGGIRTLDTGVSPYNGLANRRLQPLGHLSGVGTKPWGQRFVDAVALGWTGISRFGVFPRTYWPQIDITPRRCEQLPRTLGCRDKR